MLFKNTQILRSQIDGNIPRYISQKDKYNCGPVAIVNYWKYIGLNVTYKDVKVLSRILGTEKFPIGTYWYAMANILGKVWKTISIEELSTPAIFMDTDHFWFCSHKCNNGYLAINYSKRQTYHIISKRRMKIILKKSEVLLLGDSDDS